MHCIWKPRVVAGYLVLASLFATSAFTNSDGEKTAYLTGQTFSYFVTHPHGSLIKPFLNRISTTRVSDSDLNNIKSLFLPAIRNANRATIEKLEADLLKLAKTNLGGEKIKARRRALELAQTLEGLIVGWESRLSDDAKALEHVAGEAKEFLAMEEGSELSAQWIAANRIAGFSNSLSNHAASHGIDLQAATKLAPHGIGILYGQKSAHNHKGHLEPLWETNRHLGANNELVKFASWGNIIGTSMRVPFHHASHSFNSGDYTQAAKDLWNHADEAGAYRLVLDGAHEGVETMRGLFWVAVLLYHHEASLAKDAGVKWLGELGPASRRLRKFVQLHPHGNMYLYTFQNSVAIPMFILDFKEGYLGVLSEQWESLWQKEYASGEFYSEALNMALTTCGPFMAGLHLYLYGFGKTVRTGFENSYARYFYNGFQYGTYGFIQGAIHLNLLADMLSDIVGYTEGPRRYVFKACTILLSAFGAQRLYNGGFGDPARHAAQTVIPMAVKAMLFENIASTVIGSAIGNHHFKLLDGVFALPSKLASVVWTDSGKSDDAKKEEL